MGMRVESFEMISEWVLGMITLLWKQYVVEDGVLVDFLEKGKRGKGLKGVWVKKVVRQPMVGQTLSPGWCLGRPLGLRRGSSLIRLKGNVGH